MKQAIKQLIQEGMTITCGYKLKVGDWWDEAKIHRKNKSNSCIIIFGHDAREFDNLDDGIDFFIDNFHSSKNIGYIITRLEKKGTIDLDQLYGSLNRKTGTFQDKKYGKKFANLVRQEKKLVREEELLAHKRAS